MTVSANSSLEFTRNQLIRMSFQLAGLLPAGAEPTAADTSMAADFMNLELMALQAEGIVLRTVERTTLTLAAGTASYALPADTMDIAVGPNDQAGTILNSSGTESLVQTMSLSQYQELADKSASVTQAPTSVLIERQAVVNLTFWPVPDTTSVSFKYSRIRLLRDADTGAVTIDLARRWLQYIAYAVGAHVARAKSLTQEIVIGLETKAQRLKAILKADDNQRGKLRFVVAHSGRNW